MKRKRIVIKFIMFILFAILGNIILGNGYMTNGGIKKEVRQCLPSNVPVGVAQGIYPGRVVWSHAPGAARWDGRNGYWFLDEYNDQEKCDWLIENAIVKLAGVNDISKAWRKLFIYFNLKNGKERRGYKKGEKIVIKINQNNTYSHTDSREINASPHLLLSLLNSLVENAGVDEECITVTDPSRFITNYMFGKCSRCYPKVRYVDHIGGDGRIKSTYVDDVVKYSKDNGELANGISRDFIVADYVINMAILKGHVGQGVTLCGKNWYGAINIHSDWRKNHHNGFNQNNQGKPQYVAFVDFMGHKYLGGKTILWLVDGLYGSRTVGGAPKFKWTIEPFDGDWPSSLFASQDPVAIDMVGNDFLINQFPDMPNVNYSDMYMIEAAMADNPPSKTKYMPNGDGVILPSLGVAEHWNNSRDKQYSRNLGKDVGIELLYYMK